MIDSSQTGARFPGRLFAGIRLLLIFATGVSGVSCRMAEGKPGSRQAEPPELARIAGLPLITRAEVMAEAERYASHRWTGSAASVRHASDSMGIRIDTPDVTFRKPGMIPGFWVPGRESRGIPYQWGGFCTPEEFDRAVAAGRAAGDVYTVEKRKLLERGVSREAAGIDCSGFVSRCWKLPRAFSTRELAGLCEPLPGWNSLQPGDAIHLYNAHVLLFSGWIDRDQTVMAAYETGGPPDWKVIRHAIPLSLLQSRKYKPLRYRNIRQRPGARGEPNGGAN